MASDTKKYVALLAVFWITGTLVSFNITSAQFDKSDDRANLQTARAFFQHILITREWNSLHGGLYSAIDDVTRPNQYLNVPHRDLQSASGMELTLINPSYMTRMLSELAEQQSGFRFHITSLKPLNPDNQAAAWEKAPLASFETGQAEEAFDYVEDGDRLLYRYMAPLVAEKSCLDCHAKQGYREGEIRGAISVIIPVDRQQRPVLLHSYLAGGALGLVIILGFGVKIVQLNERLQRQAQIDGLTQIANRRYFDDYLHREWLRCRRNGHALAVILCDVDYFKRYNDHYGHQKGDDCLQRLARALKEGLRRGGDLVARYGGEEFVVVLPETSVSGAMSVAESLRAHVEALKIPHAENKIADHVTVSMGVSAAIGGKISQIEILEAADKALYRSKSSGRNTITHA